jgi:hypothetical protein
MALTSLLISAVYGEQSPDADRILEQEIVSEIMNEFRLRSQMSIDRLTDGDINRFAEMVDELGCVLELENSFPGIRDYLTHHILEGVEDWDDYAYCRCVAIGLMRFIGRQPWADAMG